MAKTALITGITGQDGSYLAELLLSKGYRVVGATRRLSAPNHWRIAHLQEQEELDAIRPDLNGNDIMRILDVPPGPEIGRAYQFLLDLRMEKGPLGADAAEEALRAWWQGQGQTPGEGA